MSTKTGCSMVMHSRRRKKKKKCQHTTGGPVITYKLSEEELKSYKDSLGKIGLQ